MERPDKRSKNSALIKGNKTYEKINKIGIPTIRPKHLSNPHKNDNWILFWSKAGFSFKDCQMIRYWKSYMARPVGQSKNFANQG